MLECFIWVEKVRIRGAEEVAAGRSEKAKGENSPGVLQT